MVLRVRTIWLILLTGAIFAALLSLAGRGAAPVADAAAPATKTLTVTLTDDNLGGEANPAAATWGRVTSSPAGIDCPSDCSEPFARGSTVALTLTRTTGYKLGDWGVFGNDPGPGCDRAAATCTLTIGDTGAAAQVEAALRPEAQLFATPEGAGTLTITPVESGRTALPCTVEVPQFRRLPDVCSPRYRRGTAVTVTAVPNPAVPGARFVGWSDYRCRTGASCRLTLRSDHYLSAFFTPAYLTLEAGSFGPVMMSPPGGLCTFEFDPATSGSSCQVLYPLQTSVTLRRDPAAAQDPTHEWTGSCRGKAATCVVTMRRNELVRAGTERTFDIPVRVRETIRLELSGKGRISLVPQTGQGRRTSCTSTCVRAGYQRGDQVLLTATGTARTRFVRWADGVKSRTRTRPVLIGVNNPVRATFARK